MHKKAFTVVVRNKNLRLHRCNKNSYAHLPHGPTSRRLLCLLAATFVAYANSMDTALLSANILYKPFDCDRPSSSCTENAYIHSCMSGCMYVLYRYTLCVVVHAGHSILVRNVHTNEIF